VSDAHAERHRSLEETVRLAHEAAAESLRVAAKILAREYAGGVAPPSLSVAIGVPVRVHDRHGDDLGLAHVPAPVCVGDVLELGRGELLPLRVVAVVETPAHAAIGALVQVAPALLT
jgi:hypothetical protein